MHSFYLPPNTDTPALAVVLHREQRSVSVDLLPGGYGAHIPAPTAFIGWWPRDLWSVGVHLGVGGEDNGARVVVQLLPLRLSFGLDRLLSRSLWRRVQTWAEARHAVERKWWPHTLNPIGGDERSTGLQITGERIRVTLWKGDGGTCYGPTGDHSDWPWRTYGWEWSWSWWDVVAGRQSYEKEPGTWHDAHVEFDGVVYTLRVRLYRERRLRRWGFVSPHRGAWVYSGDVSIRGFSHDDPDIPHGGPWSAPMFAGKGENSWDLDDDCIYATGVGTRSSPWTVDEVVARYRDAVEESRRRYGRARGPA